MKEFYEIYAKHGKNNRFKRYVVTVKCDNREEAEEYAKKICIFEETMVFETFKDRIGKKKVVEL